MEFRAIMLLLFRFWVWISHGLPCCPRWLVPSTTKMAALWTTINCSSASAHANRLLKANR